MTLYEMTGNAQYLYQMLEDGEIDEQVVNDSLEAMGVEDKLEDYCKVIRQFYADVEMFTAEKARIEGKIKTAKKAITRLEKAVLDYLAVTGKEEERCGTFNVKVSRSKAVNIVDGAKIPAEYLKPVKVEYDKAAIRKVLMSGGAVAGAELQTNESVKIK